ncbi:MAG: transcriptional regulator, GntR family [Bryobacterales bacterium]|jgi:GntR family transcriptional regulator of arabinose operon|nr:transcriptional regulator, GntR family [Bryobacterales bacterium]
MPDLPGGGGLRRPKYQEVIDALSNDIASGRYGPGQKLPSEAALVKKFQTSRITVGRAFRELQQKGLIERIAGSGSYVRGELGRGLLFGLLIPDLGETEIFDPICHGIANSPEAGDHALLWGHTDPRVTSKGEQCWRLCQQFISRKVSGVFFAPLEFEGEAAKVNRRILNAFKEANVPVVLLDRRPTATPERMRADLVGLNNRQAGFIAAEHLVQLGCKRIGFIAYQAAESTVEGRMAGYREALQKYGLRDTAEPAMQVGSDDRVKLSRTQELEAFVCVNDHVAGLLMHAFLSRGVRIPEDIRLVGIDDVRYASLLPVPLSTVRQPCPAIGQAAMRAMLDRLSHPKAPSREILFDGELVVRQSCGSFL